MSDSDSDSLDGVLLTPEQQDAEWDEWQAGGGAGGEEDEEGDATPSLFEPALLLPTPEAALAHDAQAHGFDLRAFRRQVGGCWCGAAAAARVWRVLLLQWDQARV